MKKILTFLAFLAFTFRLTAQTDYLEPVRSFDTYTGELGEYYRNVFSLLHTGFQQPPYACFTVIPSFSPEYAMSLERIGGRYGLVSNTLSRTYWQADKGSVQVNKKSVFITQSLYKTLGDIFQLVTKQVLDLDGSTAGLDGVVYYFASADAKGHVMEGRKWSPEEGSLMEKLVQVCQSAYLLTQGKNISETALAEEAATLLKALQARTKEEPDVYKRPSYVGIYHVGAQMETLSGKKIDKAPRLLSGSTDEYVEQHMVYPAQLLKEGIEGYALCEFTIDKTGTVLRPHILKSTHPAFAEETLRIVKEMPRWMPATVGEDAVGTNYTIYVPFRVERYKQLKKK